MHVVYVYVLYMNVFCQMCLCNSSLKHISCNCLYDILTSYMPRSIVLLLNVVLNRPFCTNMAAFQYMTLNETRSDVKNSTNFRLVQHTEPYSYTASILKLVNLLENRS